MLSTKVRFIWLSSFKGEDFLEIDQSETRIACGGRVRHNRWPMASIFTVGPVKQNKDRPAGPVDILRLLGEATGRFFVLPCHSISTDNKDFEIEY
jgi:hypothetical protein